MKIYERRAKFSNLDKDVSFAERVAKVQDMFEPYELSLELAAGTSLRGSLSFKKIHCLLR